MHASQKGAPPWNENEVAYATRFDALLAASERGKSCARGSPAHPAKPRHGRQALADPDCVPCQQSADFSKSLGAIGMDPALG